MEREKEEFFQITIYHHLFETWKFTHMDCKIIIFMLYYTALCVTYTNENTCVLDLVHEPNLTNGSGLAHLFCPLPNNHYSELWFPVSMISKRLSVREVQSYFEEIDRNTKFLGSSAEIRNNHIGDSCLDLHLFGFNFRSPER